MIDSWSVNNNTEINKTLDFNPVLPNYNNHNPNQYGNGNISKDDYTKYGWLFGGMR
jgi:hypothetical protein